MRFIIYGFAEPRVKKVQKLLSAAMMVSICVTLGATPVSAANNGNQDVIITSEHAAQTDREKIDDTELSTIDPEILKETLNSVGQTRILYPVEEEAESEEMVTAPATTSGGAINDTCSGTSKDKALCKGTRATGSSFHPLQAMLPRSRYSKA